MKNFVMSAMALAAVLVVPNVASADPNVEARNQAIALCRAELTAQAGETARLELDQVRVRPTVVRVDFDVWRDGQLNNVRCDVARERGAPLTIASITPALQTAALGQ